MNEKQEKLLQRCKEIFGGWLQNDFENDCKRIITDFNLEETDKCYYDAYPIVAAILLDCSVSILNGSSYESKRKEQKRLAHKYMNKSIKML